MVSTSKPLAIFFRPSPLLTISLLTLAPIAVFSQTRDCPAAAVVVVQHQQTENQNSIRIKRVDFTGNPVLSPAEQAEISAAVSKTAFNYKSLQDDRNVLRARVRQQWQQRGFFKAAVAEPDLKPDADDPSALVATIQVHAGKQYRVAEIRFVKNTVFPQEKLRAFFPLRSGDIFSNLAIANGMNEVRRLYGDNGYINLVLVPTTKIEKGSDKVEFTLEVDEGNQFRVGKVEVLGSDEAKLRQFISATGLITGSIFNDSKLQKAFDSTESDGGAGEQDAITRTINVADSTIDFRVNLTPCMTVSKK